ncbi:MAG: helix-turn-helix domain-containing protein [Veillonellaceae bacterium]|jgi:cytoskeletal protein RodZ|nr:helix-turn-helix domain-containing protein [Veillonellaceae bacterium]
MPTVGEILRSEREKKGLSIKDIEKATSIRVLYLEAIEADNYNVIPGEVYLKGFIRNYANCLKLDSQSVINLYHQSKASATSEAESANESKSDQPSSGRQADGTDSQNGKKSKLIVVGAAAIILIGSLLWAIGNRNTVPQQAPDPKPAPMAPVVPSQPAVPNPPITDKPAAQAKPIIVNAKYTDSCWTLVIADGKEIYEGIPKIGDTLTWEAQDNLSVQFGNARGVEITHNGQYLGKLGGKGEVIKKNFKAAK